ncbi:hypothetical protein [Kineococcus sp. G2]|uniref:hypothetical protein n=1 Tax=Kineococcus sp. G2 TaxID=3127484 RepID=UPI00301B7A90
MTTAPQSPPPSARPRSAGPTASSIADRRVMAVVTALLISITVLQRFGLPLGPVQLSVSVLVALGGIGYLLFHGDAVENSGATRVFAAAMAVCFLVAGIVLLRDRTGNITSLVYLPVIWVVFCFRLHPARFHLYPRVLDRFEKIMVAFAAIGVLQTAAQAAGVWSYRDFVLDLVPAELLFTGYNTSYPIEYGSPIIKANGFVFLEPSVYAQFLAMALLSVLVRRASPVRAGVLGIALVCTISGTGLLFAGFGIAVLAVRRGGRWTARIVAAAALAGAVALATPFGEIIASRMGETSQTNSSGSLRFVQPYQRIVDTWGADPFSVLIGDGAGRADELADRIFRATGLPINFSGVAKLLLEYGVVGAVLFGAFVALALVARAPAPTLAWSGVFANAFLTGALLQPQVLYLLVPLSSLFIGLRFESQLDEERRARPRRSPRPAHDAGQRLGEVPVTVVPARPNGLERS